MSSSKQLTEDLKIMFFILKFSLSEMSLRNGKEWELWKSIRGKTGCLLVRETKPCPQMNSEEPQEGTADTTVCSLTVERQVCICCLQPAAAPETCSQPEKCQGKIEKVRNSTHVKNFL